MDTVAVRVQVDETRRDHQAVAIDLAADLAQGELAHGNDLVAHNGHVAGRASLARTVVDRAAAEQDVGIDGPGGLTAGKAGHGQQEKHERRPHTA